MSPTELEHRQAQAVAYEQQGLPLQALALWQQLAQLAPTPVRCSNWGGLAFELGRYAEAAKAFEYELAQGFDAHSRQRCYGNLGATYEALGQLDQAATAFDQARRLAPDEPGPVANWAKLEIERGHIDNALAELNSAHARWPQHHELSHLKAYALSENNQCEAALALWQQLLERTEDAGERARLKWEMSTSLMLLGRYAEAWEAYEARWLGGPNLAGSHRHYRGIEIWQGQPLAGKSIGVWCEQGLGDRLMGVRFLHTLVARGAEVYAEASADFFELWQRSFKQVHWVEEGGLDRLKLDYHCPLLGLPHALGIRAADLPGPMPYLLSDPAKVEAWRQRLQGDPHFKIGLVWSGGMTKSRGTLRAVQLLSFQARYFDWLQAFPDLSFYSLQKGARSSDKPDLPLIDHSDALLNFDDTAALVMNLDLILSVDTSVIHLAGALNKPVWVPLRFHPGLFFGLEGERMAWYDSVRLFRQNPERRWLPVLQGLAQALAQHRGHALPPLLWPQEDQRPSQLGAELFDKEALNARALKLAVEAAQRGDDSEASKQFIASGEHPEAWFNHGIFLQQKNRLDEAWLLLERSWQQRPQANKALALARLALQRQQPDHVQHYLEKLPSDEPEARLLWPRLYEQQGQTEKALAAAVALSQEQPDERSLSLLGNLYYRQRQFSLALASYAAALEHAPQDITAGINHARTLAALGRFSEAESGIKALLARLDGHHREAEARFHLALYKLIQGQWEQGFALYQSRQEHPLAEPLPLWSGHDTDALLLYGEQGLGDSLLFGRWIGAAAKKTQRLWLWVPTALIRLMQMSLSGVEVIDKLDPLPPATVRLPLPSLPYTLQLTQPQGWRPYLKVDAPLVQHWRQRLEQHCRGSALRVGLVFSGGHQTADNDLRSLKSAEIQELLQWPLQWVLLQQGPGRSLLAEVDQHGAWDAGAELTDLADTAALLLSLDVVVSVCTSVLHLAANLAGVRAIGLIPFEPYWVWHHSGSSPWYPEVQLLRQSQPLQWAPVVAQLKHLLLEAKASAEEPAQIRSSAAQRELWLDQAVALHQQQQLDQAEALYLAAAQGTEPNADWHHLFGLLKTQQQQLALGLEHLKRAVALAAEPNYLASLAVAEHPSAPELACQHLAQALERRPEELSWRLQLARWYVADKKTAAAEALVAQQTDPSCQLLHAQLLMRRRQFGAVRALLNPLPPQEASLETNIQLELAVAALSQTDYLAAIDHARRALACEPVPALAAHARAAWGTALLGLGRYEEGLPLYESRFESPSRDEDRRSYAVPAWQGQDIRGQRLLLWAEGGQGDALCFMRYADELKRQGVKVLLELPRRVAALGRQSGHDVVVRGLPLERPFDYHASLSSCPWLCGSTPENLPPPARLLVSPQQRAAMAQQLGPRRRRWRVGLCWQGGIRERSPGLNLRSLSGPEDLAPLAALAPEVTFVWLQTGERAAERPGFEVLAPTLEDFTDTAAALLEVDLLITVDTAISHLAASLNVLCWQLTPHDCYWLWAGQGGTTPWYPSMWLFRQQPDEQWPPVVNEVAQCLSAFISERN